MNNNISFSTQLKKLKQNLKVLELLNYSNPLRNQNETDKIISYRVTFCMQIFCYCSLIVREKK